jgi:hypothetical protein
MRVKPKVSIQNFRSLQPLSTQALVCELLEYVNKSFIYSICILGDTRLIGLAKL